MATRRIRITGAGIYGQSTDKNPTGEYPIGHEFDTDAELPASWAGRAEVVGEEAGEGSNFVVGEADIERILADHRQDTALLRDRAERAEADLQKANEQIEALNLKLKAFDRDGDGNPGGSNAPGEAATAEEIRSAVGMLDGATDAHWTAAGLPAVDAVADLVGKSVTRAAITDAAPDAKRPA